METGWLCCSLTVLFSVLVKRLKHFVTILGVSNTDPPPDSSWLLTLNLSLYCWRCALLFKCNIHQVTSWKLHLSGNCYQPRAALAETFSASFETTSPQGHQLLQRRTALLWGQCLSDSIINKQTLHFAFQEGYVVGRWREGVDWKKKQWAVQKS